MPWFWIYSEFLICQDYTGFRICLNYSWICLIMSWYVWICLNMPEYAWICLNLPEWLLFYISPFSHLFYNTLSAWIREYFFERLQEVIAWRNMSLFSWRDKIWFFSIAAYSICFVFYFKLNIFTSKIWICCYIPSPRGAVWGLGAVNLDIPF